MLGYNFNTKDGKKGTVTFLENPQVPGEWDAEFSIDGSVGITGGGDAFVIFGTVIKVIDDFLKNYQPNILTFTAMKGNGGNESRVDLYRKMLKKMASKVGYSFDEESKERKSLFTMRKV